MKTGDLVALKSGGPDMVVLRAQDDGQLHCLYFCSGEIKAALLPPAVLVPAKPAKRRPAAGRPR